MDNCLCANCGTSYCTDPATVLEPHYKKGYQYGNGHNPVYGPGYYGPVNTPEEKSSCQDNEHFGHGGMHTNVSMPSKPVHTRPKIPGSAPYYKVPPYYRSGSGFAPGSIGLGYYEPTYIPPQPLVIQTPTYVQPAQPEPSPSIIPEVNSNIVAVGIPCVVCCMIL